MTPASGERGLARTGDDPVTAANMPSDLSDLWDRADALEDEGVGDLASDLRVVLAQYDDSRLPCGHTPNSCGCKQDRILWNIRDADIDEIVIHDPEMVHIEQMNDRCWWIGIYLRGADENGPLRWSGNFWSDSRGRMGFSPQDDDVRWAQDESHEEKAAR